MGSSVIFSGSAVRTLKNKMLLGSGTVPSIEQGTVDPTSTATSGEPGSLYMNSSTGIVYRKLDSGSSTNWVSVSSGSSGINWITNGDAEAGTTGWNTYADAAATRPVDGTGGSPTHISIASSATAPLAGTKSFVITNSGSTSAQGEGVSYAFTTNTANYATMQSVSFDYMVNSGTFTAGSSTTDGDLIIYFYDVTNGVLIEPSNIKLFSNSSTVPGKFTATFQTASNSTSYRLIFHVAGTGTSAWSLKVDNIVVGPQVKMSSPAISKTMDLSSNFTPTGFGTVTNKSIWGWRVGDRLVVQGHFTAGTATGVTASLDFSGYTIDSAKMHSSSIGQPVGDLERVGAAISDLVIFYDGSTTNKLYFNDNASSAGSISGRNGTQVSNNNDSFNFNFSVPIAGWDTDVATSSEQSGRNIIARYKSSAGQSIPDNTVTIIDFGTLVHDLTSSVTTGASWKFTAPESGYYWCAARTAMTSTATGDNAEMYLYKNGSNYSTLASGITASTNQNLYLIGGDVVYLNAGDYIDFRFAQDSANNLARSLSSSPEKVNCSIQKIQAPLAVQASETVAARYYFTGGTAATATATRLNYSVSTFDTHGAVTTGASTWKFTAPVSGKYEVFARCHFDTTGGSWDGGDALDLRLYKNGSYYSFLDLRYISATSTNQVGVSGSDFVQLNAGDYIHCEVTQSSGVTQTFQGTAGINYILIKRIGN